MKIALFSIVLAAFSAPAFAHDYACDAAMAGTTLQGDVFGSVRYTQSPFTLVFTAQDGSKTSLFEATSFCGQSVKVNQCTGPNGGSFSADHAILDCEDSGKENRASSTFPPGSNVTDGSFWFDIDHGQLDCWGFMKSPQDRATHTLVHFDNCR